MIGHIMLVVIGTVMVLVAIADLVNTLVTTSNSHSSHVGRWPSRAVVRVAFGGD